MSHVHYCTDRDYDDGENMRPGAATGDSVWERTAARYFGGRVNNEQERSRDYGKSSVVHVLERNVVYKGRSWGRRTTEAIRGVARCRTGWGTRIYYILREEKSGMSYGSYDVCCGYMAYYEKKRVERWVVE